MNLPAFHYWNIWLGIGLFRFFAFWVSAFFWFGYIYWLCPEARLPQFLPEPLEPAWLAVLLIGDMLLLGYVVTAIAALIKHLIRNWRCKPDSPAV
jgi:hypothetical protein